MYEFLETIKILFIALGIALAIMLALALLMAYPTVAYEKYACRKTAEKMGKEWIYEVIPGCMIKVEDGSYIDIRQYRVVE